MELNAAFSLADTSLMGRAATQPWKNPADYWPRLTDATADLSAPVVTLGLEALAWNTEDLLRRAGGSPIRVASKSIRVRSVLEAVLAQPGYQGILAFTLAEALWLSECGTSDDIVIAYPTADIPALRRLGANANAAANVTIMVDSVDQLDLVDATIAPGKRAAPIRVCLDFDASWRSRALGHIGVLRSPIHEPAELRSLAEAVLARPGFTLVGIMSYEAQIAGVGNAPIGKPLAGLLMRTVQHFSADELAERRHRAIGSVREISELEFVNGGGTGSIERTVAEGWITEVTAGSGLFGPHLFDNYQHFEVAPATAFALDVVRNADAQSATLLGGGWIASGVAGPDRLPKPVWPGHLTFAPREGAGEVQSPVLGEGAGQLRPGDRVWLRHTKSGEIMEHANEVVPVVFGSDGTDAAVALDPLPTYRGEGHAFI